MHADVGSEQRSDDEGRNGTKSVMTGEGEVAEEGRRNLWRTDGDDVERMIFVDMLLHH